MKKTIAQHSIKAMLICLLAFTGIQQLNAQSGNALSFDGTSGYADLSSSINLVSSSFTLECWFKLTNGNNNRNRLITVGDGIGNNYHATGISIRDDNGLIEYYFYGDDGSYSSTANDGKWHHVAFTFDNTSKAGILYLDGVSVSSKTFSGNLIGSGQTRLGSRTWSGSGDYHKGSIDEVRIWNTVRTASQIQTNRFQSVANSTSGLLAYYNCNAGSGTTLADATSNNYSGSLQGGVSWVASTANIAINHPGNALNFDGTNDYVSCGTSIGNFGTGDFTIEFNMLTTITSGSNRILLSKRNVCGHQSFFNLYMQPGGKVGFEIDQDAAGTNYKDFQVSNGTTLVNDGKWHHIAYTRSGTSLKIYVDGINTGSATTSGTTNLSNTANLFIGYLNTGCSGTYFSGLMDEVRIWNVARTQTQIQSNMINVIDPTTTGLLAYYRFDAANAGGTNTNATLLQDLTSNKYDGTLTNFGLSSTSSNFVESYAMVVPTASSATSIGSTSLTANWTAPSVGTVTNYLLDVSTSSTFASFVSGYNALSVSGTSQSVTGLSVSTTYYYRVRADKTSVTGQGGYSSTITTSTYSNNANLSALTISSGTLSPTFVSGTTSYTASVTNGTSSVTITPTRSQANATIQARVNGGSYSSVTSGSASGSLSLNIGSNTINILVTAQDGTTTQTYTITVLRAAVAPGNCLNFDGSNDYVDLGNSFSLASSSFTLESWFKLSNGNNNRNRIITIGDGVGNSYHATGISIRDDNGLIEYYFYGDDGSYSSTANDGKWHHVAFAFDNTTKIGKLYLDGANVATRTFGGSLIASTQARLSGNTWGGGDYFKGSIDEVRIWNSVRNSTQVQSNMFNTISASSSGLVGYYNFDDGTAGSSNATVTTLYDQTSNGYNGTLANFSLSGSSSNWVESYAMVVPTATAASSITSSGFTANWIAPTTGTVDNGYRLDVSTNSAFSSFVSGYNGLNVSGTSKSVTGLSSGTSYYYRVRADKTSVTGQGDNSNVISTATCTSTSSSSSQNVCSNQLPYSWNGLTFTSAGTQTKTGLVNSVGCDSSATLTLTVGSPVTPIVSISTASTTVCSGNSVTFTANGSNGGSSPQYQWKKNGNNLTTGTSITFAPNTLSTGDVITCVLTANNSCQTTATATSNAIVLTVNQSPAAATISSQYASNTTAITMCDLGSVVSLYPSIANGVWSSSNSNTASVARGNTSTYSADVIAIANGSANIIYTLTTPNTVCTTTTTIAVTVAKQATPASIVGSNNLCVGSSTVYTTTSTGGVWSTTGRAAINSSGVATGTSAGATSIKYTVTNLSGCSASSLLNVSVNAQPSVPSIAFAAGTTGISGSGGYCHNKTFTLLGSPSGGAWGSVGAFSITSGGVVTTAGSAGSGSVTYTITDANGCSNSRTIGASVVASCKGINSQPSIVDGQQLTIYPNPAHTTISLNIKALIGAGTVVVTDLYGKQLKQQSLSIGTNIVDVSSFAKGMYLVSIITEQGKQTQKVVVE